MKIHKKIQDNINNPEEVDQLLNDIEKDAIKRLRDHTDKYGKISNNSNQEGQYFQSESVQNISGKQNIYHMSTTQNFESKNTLASQRISFKQAAVVILILNLILNIVLIFVPIIFPKISEPFAPLVCSGNLKYEQYGSINGGTKSAVLCIDKNGQSTNVGGELGIIMFFATYICTFPIILLIYILKYKQRLET